MLNFTKRVVVFLAQTVAGIVILTLGAFLFTQHPWNHFFLWGLTSSLYAVAALCFALRDWYTARPRFSLSKWFHAKCVEGFPPPKPLPKPAPARRRKLGHRFGLRSMAIKRD